MALQLFPVSLWHFPSNMTGCGLSSKVCHECLLKKTKGDTVLAVVFTTEGISVLNTKVIKVKVEGLK